MSSKTSETVTVPARAWRHAQLSGEICTVLLNLLSREQLEHMQGLEVKFQGSLAEPNELLPLKEIAEILLKPFPGIDFDPLKGLEAAGGEEHGEHAPAAPS